MPGSIHETGQPGYLEIKKPSFQGFFQRYAVFGVCCSFGFRPVFSFRKGTKRSSPVVPAFPFPTRIRMARINIIGLVDTVPASRNAMFIVPPKNASVVVNKPTIKPAPTSTSPTSRGSQKRRRLEQRCVPGRLCTRDRPGPLLHPA
ncbi:hypothetical protein SAMN05518683_104196 [Salibacterium halotolerans]|uniref:Uncharacterized protein n=1 Tax=Salibacterium halotolerans TaxID=1884432 RepID=A0A1I5PQ97_9BACI|nr:hypothetical protein SAMN05518683_104196 [Salibacterium halotolerans]